MTEDACMDLASDLHVEFGPPAVAWPTDADAAGVDLLLPGDVGRVMDGSFLRGLTEAASHYRHVFAVLGNHEYYNAGKHTMEEVEAAARAQVAALPNVTLLQREAVRTAA